ncbi:MAG TPA: hypothetical protein VGG99_18845, partial [Acetobacteraceae bacterium]
MGKDRPGAGTEGSPRALKPPPNRLYGRARGHKLRPRQQVLLDVTLPRLALRIDAATPPPLEGGGWGEGFVQRQTADGR